jgi:coenzyme F420 hydrogenase subunit beta
MAHAYSIEDYVGPCSATYVAYREERPHHVASGGVVTALAVSLLRSGAADGVAMVRATFAADSEAGYEFRIITDPEDVAEFGGSVYYDAPLQRHWQEVAEFDGRVAVCGLPCHVRALRGLQRQGKSPGNVVLVISLFCGHNCTVGLMRAFLERNGIEPARVRDVRFVRTYIEGVVEVDTDDGEQHRLSFSGFNALRNLWVDSKRLCMSCDEHFGAQADVSVGDIFLPEYRDLGVRVSAVVVRTDAGERAWDDLVRSGALNVSPVDVSEVFRAQRRVVIASKDTLSRYRAARMLGYTTAKPVEGRFRLRTFATYSFLYAMNRFSQTPAGKRFVRSVPQKLAFAAVLGVKAVHSTLRR